MVAWNDNNVVTVMSNGVSLSPTASAQRYSSASKSKISVTCPNSVKFYNATMGGVDRLDGNLQSCRIAMRGKKCISYYLYLLDVCVNNTWIIHRRSNKYIDQNSFKTFIAEQ